METILLGGYHANRIDHIAKSLSYYDLDTLEQIYLCDNDREHFKVSAAIRYHGAESLRTLIEQGLAWIDHDNIRPTFLGIAFGYRYL